LLGRTSAKARIEKWGAEEFNCRMKEWGRLGGRPKNSGKKIAKKGEKAE
jgi:hypothetical protein